METDLLRIGEPSTVAITSPDGQTAYTFNSSDLHRIDEAISRAFAASGLSGVPEDYVYTVTNDATGVSHRYRLNAHGNVVLLPEEY